MGKKVTFSKTVKEYKTYGKNEYDRTNINKFFTNKMTIEEFLELKILRIKSSIEQGIFMGSEFDINGYMEFNKAYRKARINR